MSNKLPGHQIELGRIIDLSIDMICVAGMDGYFKYVNPAVKKILGYSQKELLSKPFIDFIHPDDHGKNNEEVASLREGKKTLNFENRYICRDGSIRIFSWSASPSPEEGLMYCIGRDITEAKSLEESLRKTEAQYRLLFNLLPYGGEVLDKKGNIVQASPSTANMLGYEVSDLIGKHITEFISEKSVLTFKEMFPELLKGKSAKVDISMVHKSGEKLDVLRAAQPVLDKEGHVQSILALSVDITERKKAERMLIESEERYRDLLNTLNSGVAIYKVINEGKSGDDYIVQSFNKFALDHEGRNLDEVVGKSLKEIRPNIEEYGLIEVFRKVWKTGNYEFYPAKVYIDEKFTNHYENRVFRLPNGEIVAVYDDVTLHKEAERKIAENEEKLRAIFENIIDVFYEVSVDGMIMDISPSIEILSKGQYKREDLIGKNLLDFYSSNDQRDIFLQEIKQNGLVNDYEISLRNLDGSVHPCSISARLWGNDKGGAKKIIGVLRDIADRKQRDKDREKHSDNLEELVKERTKELEEKNKELQRYFDAFVERELRMKELFDENEKLKKKVGESK